MRLLLAQAPFRDTFGYSMPPPGLLRLGGEVRRRGWAVELEDLAFRLARGELANGSLLCESAARLLLKRGSPDVIGLSVMGATLPAAIEIGRRLHDLSPDTRLLLGGPGLFGVEDEVLRRFPWFDALVRGEAERTLPELLERWEHGRDLAGVSGTTWRTDAGKIEVEKNRPQMADLRDLAPYARDLLPDLAEYKRINGESEGLTPLDSGRGCVFDCSFCTIGRYWDRRSRPLPAELLADEVHALDGLEGAKNAYLCHDLFAADRDHALAFCEAMLVRGARPWECRARVDHLDPELLELMGRAGCYRVLLGIESGAASVRAQARKGQYASLDVLEVIRNCDRAGIRPILSLILGLPGEEQEELEASLSLIARAALATDALISLHLPNPQPGCGLNETHGKSARPIDEIPPDMAFGCGESAPERALIQAHPDLFSSWSLLPMQPHELLHLARIASELPPVLAAFPRTWALLRDFHRCTHHELFRAWQSSELEFQVFAGLADCGLVRDALAWEEAVAGFDGALGIDSASPGGELDLEPGCWIQSRARVVQLQHDLVRLREPLIEDFLPRPQASNPTWLAVSPTPGGVASDRIQPEVGELLRSLEVPRRVAELEEQWPAVRRALVALGHAGLIESSSAPTP